MVKLLASCRFQTTITEQAVSFSKYFPGTLWPVLMFLMKQDKDCSLSLTVLFFLPYLTSLLPQDEFVVFKVSMWTSPKHVPSSKSCLCVT